MEYKEETFSFTYSAAQRSEIENIRKKYVRPQESKMDQLRKLDRSAGKKAQSLAITLGVIGTLIMGSGMSLVMSELSALAGEFAMVTGIAVGIVGMILVALAYPVYNAVLKRERQRIAPEILRLTDELMSSFGSEQ